MSYLIDTNVILEVSKGERCDRSVAQWYAAIDPEALFLSVLVIGELRDGIERLRTRDRVRYRRLDRWLLLVVELFADRTLTVDRRIAESWGRLNAAVRLPTVDGLIAATALIHRLTVVTRNERDYARARVPFLNPFEPPQ
ncbi:MAG TPA: type II toxin-antitoxin system VapC family toxin [Geminicoccaceae bacterium]|nr:type II toxin-antitoxin system VapC family toxin [Geminicoccaceae bacterium]